MSRLKAFLAERLLHQAKPPVQVLEPEPSTVPDVPKQAGSRCWVYKPITIPLVIILCTFLATPFLFIQSPIGTIDYHYQSREIISQPILYQWFSFIPCQIELAFGISYECPHTTNPFVDTLVIVTPLSVYLGSLYFIGLGYSETQRRRKHRRIRNLYSAGGQHK